MFATGAETRRERLVLFTWALGPSALQLFTRTGGQMVYLGNSYAHCRQDQLGRGGVLRHLAAVEPWGGIGISSSCGPWEEMGGKQQSSCWRCVASMCCWRRPRADEMAPQPSTTTNVMMPCRMAAQPPADPPWSICNHGQTGFRWPRPDQIGNRRLRMDAVIQSP